MAALTKRQRLEAINAILMAQMQQFAEQGYTPAIKALAAVAALNVKPPQGFAAISPERRRAISEKGRRVIQQQGKGHKFTSDEAREAARKSVESRRHKRQQRQGE